jgi:uncharacterized repeat protein (TIGR01451 family)
VTYTITVTNDGDDVLENLTVNDSILGDLSGSFADTLDPGDSESHDFTHVVSSTDPDPLENVVTADAVGVDSDEAVSSTASCVTVIANPGIQVTKSCTPEAGIGDSVAYSVTVTNTGDETLTGIVVVDSILGNLSGSFVNFLDPGESDTQEFEHVVTPDDPDPLINVVIALGTGAISGDVAQDAGACRSDVTHVPGIAVEKTCPTSAVAGDLITYSVTVTNTGDEPLTNVTAQDSLAGDISDLFSDTLDVGASETVEYTHQVTPIDPDPLENTVIVSGMGEDSTVTAEATTGCATAVPPVSPPAQPGPSLPVTGTDVQGGLIVLAALIMGGLMFLFLGWQPAVTAGVRALGRRPRGRRR